MAEEEPRMTGNQQSTSKLRRPSPREGVRVLIVDHDDAVRIPLAQLLQRAGYVVETAATAEEALLAGEQTDWDCLVADLALPESGGLELYYRLLIQGRSRLPAVFLAAHPVTAADIGLQRAGWIRLLRRPCATSDLLAALERSLGAPGTL